MQLMTCRNYDFDINFGTWHPYYGSHMVDLKTIVYESNEMQKTTVHNNYRAI
jgi:hypothetical protein